MVCNMGLHCSTSSGSCVLLLPCSPAPLLLCFGGVSHESHPSVAHFLQTGSRRTDSRRTGSLHHRSRRHHRHSRLTGSKHTASNRTVNSHRHRNKVRRPCRPWPTCLRTAPMLAMCCKAQISVGQAVFAPAMLTAVAVCPVCVCVCVCVCRCVGMFVCC